RFAANHATDRRVELRVAEIELRRTNIRFSLIGFADAGLKARLCVDNLLRSRPGSIDLRLPLCDATSSLRDFPLSCGYDRTIRLQRLSGGERFCFSSVI